MLDSQTLKKDFPIFRHHPDLVYLDSAATALKPQTVIDAEREYLEQYSTNIARGLYPLAERTMEKFEKARENIAHFIGAENAREIIFTSGTTASINLAAQLIEHHVQKEHTLIVTEMEHHSNFLPWQELAARKNAQCLVAPIDASGRVDTEALVKLVDKHTTLVAFSALSNVLGTINPVQEIIAQAKQKNPQVLVLVDAAQAIAHLPIDVRKWDADFVAFSGHKAFAPTGVGVLYGKQTLLETLSPVTFGGGMVLDVYPPPSAQRTRTAVYREIPYRFEAGTPHIGGIIALSAALDYISATSLTDIRLHELLLIEYALKRLQETFSDTIRIIGPQKIEERSGIIAFALNNIHPHDIAQLLGEQGICVRAGEHCTAPLHRALGLPATTRVSFSIYNTKQDVDTFIRALEEIQKMFSS